MHLHLMAGKGRHGSARVMYQRVPRLRGGDRLAHEERLEAIRERDDS